MSIQFPIIIDNQPELNRLIRDIAREVVKEVRPEKLRPFLSKQDCYREVGSRAIVDRAIKNGNLRLRMKEGSIIVLRKDFETWINNETPVRRYPETKVRR